MARYTVACDTCGLDMDFVTFGGNSRDRQWRADHWSHECDECKQKRITAENEKNAVKNREDGLPVLVGSEKQIAWAETIRSKFLDISSKVMENIGSIYEVIDEVSRIKIKGIIFKNPNLKHEINVDFVFQNNIEQINYKLTKLFENQSSSFWIDRRGRELHQLLEEIEDEEIVVQKDIEKNLQKEAELEATVRPSEPITETIATISIISDEKISISFPEKREDFRLLVKEHRYSWSGGAWERKIGYISGNITDRVANIGNILLDAGFIVRIFDQELRQKAIDGIYEPEHTRWIQLYKGKFSIRWRRYHEDFYEEARKIPTSKWDNPTVDVKSEQFEAVLDFANEYDFRFTSKAQELLEKAKRAKEAQLIPEVKKGKESTKVKLKERDFTVEEVEVDEAFLD